MWNRAGNRTKRASFQSKGSSEQTLGIRMAGRAQDILDGSLLNDPSCVHDDDTVRNLGHDAEIMGDQQKRELELVTKACKQIKDLLLDGNIERGRGFIGD